MCENEYDNIIEPLTIMYYKLFPEADKVSPIVKITDNLDKTHGELRPDLKKQINEKSIFNSDCNGRLVMPDSLDKPIVILLDENKIIEYTKDKSMTWIGTFAHELTHAIDFYNMARVDGVSYDIIEMSKNYLLFRLWTEYHAKKYGYLFLRNYFMLNGQLPEREEQIEHIISTEWPIHRDKHYDGYHAVNDGYYQMYITMHLLGRYSAWCDLFPEYFNHDLLNKEYEWSAPWICNIFSFLRSHEDLYKVIPCFDEFKSIINENWLVE